MIRIRGATEHNLRGVDLDLPLGRWIAVTGPSGSGKSSLVFDTLVKEGERRFLGSLSTKARQFYGKLGRANVERLEGLPATIAIGQHATTPHSRSTVGTLTGTLALLRLVFARDATAPDSSAQLTRSHFSFNHPLGRCGACAGLGVEDRVDPAKLVADPGKSLRQGALVPTLKNGYTVYSQVTLEVMDRICRVHGFDVDTPWRELSDEQRGVVLHGTRALKVPFGKHPIESRMKWEGITARPREEGYYRGLVPVIEETLSRNRNENILRFVSSAPCRACGGTRLGELGREARLGETTLPELLRLPADRLVTTLRELPESKAWGRVRPDLDRRLERMVRLGLGHLALDRSSTSLSGGEAQRLRLAAQLGAGLGGMLVALDEPTLGLHPESQAGMRDVLDELLGEGNSLIVVEHDHDMVRHADHVVALGPGAGREGGRVVATDLPGHAASGPREEHPLGRAARPKTSTWPGSGTLILEGASLHNLEHARLELALGALNVVLGPSGAGKSSLVFGTLLPALRGERGGAYESLRCSPSGEMNVEAVDASPIGKTPRSTPATWCGLFDEVRKRFARTDDAKARALTASHFSFNGAKGRCATCEGLGVTRLGLHLFEDVELPCDACGGARYAPAVLEAKLRGLSIADVLGLDFREAHAFFAGDAKPERMCAAMLELGLGYLPLGASSGSLSRGESQRIKLGTLLGSHRRERSIVLLDEPDRGLSPPDVAALLAALDALVVAGHTVVAISHHRHVWAAADRRIEVRAGRTEHDPDLDWDELSTRRPAREVRGGLDLRPLELRGVRTYNLQGVTVRIPRGKRTAVCGVSGSGKSSLVFDTLCSEAERRFAESLPFQVRRFLRRLPEAALESASGLTPVLNLRQTSAPAGARSTVATLSECGPLLRLLFARAGLRAGEPCGLTASHFSRERTLGACTACAGRGRRRHCDPARLVTDPARPLVATEGAGALAGTRPGRFFTEADGQHVATLHAALRSAGVPDASALLHGTAWSELPVLVRDLALHGSGETSLRVNWTFASKAEGEGRHAFEGTWDGLLVLVEREAARRARSKRAAEWAMPLGEVDCETCAGSGLAPPARATTVRGRRLDALEGLPLAAVVPALETARPPAEEPPVTRAALDALLPELRERIGELEALGLGHLSLGRRARTLSVGELQRLRLAGALRSGLAGLTLVLDEPSAGLHERDVKTLTRRLDRFQAEGNTVVVVSHRPSLLRAADHLIELGPGAGAEGGRVLAEGPPARVLAGDTPTARALADLPRPAPRDLRPSRIRVRGARVHNLQGIDIELPLSGLVCISGVSGSGKSSLAFDVLAPSLRAPVTPAGCDAVEWPEGAPPFVAVHDARGAGRGQSPLATLDVAGELASLFEGADLPRRSFEPGHAAGRCSACKGTGREHVAMDVLADLDLPCERCDGRRFRPEVLARRWRGRNIAEILDAPAADLLVELRGAPASQRTPRREKLRAALEALDEVAVAHVPLGRAWNELSGGEAARIRLAANLRRASSPALHVFDEPSAGLHEVDLQRVVAAFRRLADRGDLVVATEHRLSFLRAADWVVDLGPEGGPGGGRLMDQGPPDSLRQGHTADALREPAKA